MTRFATSIASPRRWRALALALAVLAAAGAAPWAWRLSSGEPGAGRAAHDLDALLGGLAAISPGPTPGRPLGGGYTIVNVWASWCVPCRRELPALQRLAARAAGDAAGVAVVGVSVDKDADFVREYLRDTGITFANYLDPAQEVARGAFAVATLPQTLVLDPEGRLVQRIVGERNWDDTSLRSVLALERSVALGAARGSTGIALDSRR